MNTKIGIGIISFAHGHANAYCNQMQTFDDVELVACWDDNVERGEAAATQYDMRYSPHLEDITNHPEIHAVIVTCETNRHAEMVVAAASDGKDILCQKPMALTLEDCDRIAEIVEKTGVKFMMGHQMRRDPANIAMKELIDSGVLGKIGVLRRRHCINALFSEAFVTGPSRWHIDPKKNMGMFMDDASHATDFIHWMLGKPTRVIAEIDNILTDVAPDDTGLAVYRFAGGEMAILLNTSVTLAGENTTEIYGDEGVVIQNYGDAPSCNIPRPADAVALKLYTRDEPLWKDLGIPIPAGHGERIGGVPRPFIDCLKNGTDPDVTAEDGRVAVEMVLGAYRSAQEGRRVTFPL
ncbi:Gfo/Idh/MocA family oxidoreductase [Candidatus Poribacteria bacterium]|nr:Gfo/Idh/MocA family oxidoreductase [Candidatus Poribacteria bacterium]MYA56819.1 Gfo/Idh/MocA family oxidoreductase [Candidatus Poribacteria bacterium]